MGNRSGAAREGFLVFSVFVVASCGLAYELIMGALGSYLLGDSVLQFSTVIGSYLCAMGLGAHAAKWIPDGKLAEKFVDVELAVGLLGGASSLALMLVYFYFPPSFRSCLYAWVFCIGALVGMEVPIVMRLLHQNGAGLAELVSRVLSFDYLGALFVSLMFPLVMMPALGLWRSALAFGLSNVGIAALTARRCGEGSFGKKRQLLAAGCAAALGLMAWQSENIAGRAQKGLYGSTVLVSKSSRYQNLLVTKEKDNIRLFINGNLQFSSKDEKRYHEALVHPAMKSVPYAKRVLVLGGGDGLAVREILRYPSVERVDLVDLDGQMTALFRDNELLRGLNGGALSDPRVRIVNEDAASFLKASGEFWDVMVIDFPDPSNYALGKLYSVPFYELVKERLAQKGAAVVQSTSPYYAPKAYWTVFATLRAAGFEPSAYHAYVPSFGDWGFFVFGHGKWKMPELDGKEGFAWLDAETMRAMFSFPKDMPRLEMEPSTLGNQNIVEQFSRDWDGVW